MKWRISKASIPTRIEEARESLKIIQDQILVGDQSTKLLEDEKVARLSLDKILLMEESIFKQKAHP